MWIQATETTFRFAASLLMAASILWNLSLFFVCDSDLFQNADSSICRTCHRSAAGTNQQPWYTRRVVKTDFRLVDCAAVVCAEDDCLTHAVMSERPEVLIDMWGICAGACAVKQCPGDKMLTHWSTFTCRWPLYVGTACYELVPHSQPL